MDGGRVRKMCGLSAVDRKNGTGGEASQLRGNPTRRRGGGRDSDGGGGPISTFAPHPASLLSLAGGWVDNGWTIGGEWTMGGLLE